MKNLNIAMENHKEHVFLFAEISGGKKLNDIYTLHESFSNFTGLYTVNRRWSNMEIFLRDLFRYIIKILFFLFIFVHFYLIYK